MTFSTPLIVVLILLGSASLFGQRSEISEAEFKKVIDGAKSVLELGQYLEKEVSETFAKDILEPEEKGIWTREVDRPNRIKIKYEIVRNGIKREYNSIRFDGVDYIQLADGKWQNLVEIKGFSGKIPMSESTAKYFISTSSSPGNIQTHLYTLEIEHFLAGSTREKTRITTSKYWIDVKGRFVKTIKESYLDGGKRRLTTSEFEYGKHYKIVAPTVSDRK